MEKTKILFLSANPLSTDRLKLDEEIRSISEKIRGSEHRDFLELISVWAIRPDDVIQSFNEHDPQIVHFSGHGDGRAGLTLVDNDGEATVLSNRALKALFNTFKHNIRVVVLNACYSQEQAKLLADTIDCTVGMSDKISDKAAIAFASSFYRAIGFGRSIQESFEQGKVALLMEGIPEDNTPKLWTKPGIDPSQVFILSDQVLYSVLEGYIRILAVMESESAIASEPGISIVSSGQIVDLKKRISDTSDKLRLRQEEKSPQKQVRELSTELERDCNLIREHRVIFDRPAFRVSCVREFDILILKKVMESVSIALDVGVLFSNEDKFLERMPPKGEYRTPYFQLIFRKIDELISIVQNLVREFERFVFSYMPEYGGGWNFMSIYTKTVKTQTVVIVERLTKYMDDIDKGRNDILVEVNRLLVIATLQPFEMIKLSSSLIKDGTVDSLIEEYKRHGTTYYYES